MYWDHYHTVSQVCQTIPDTLLEISPQLCKRSLESKKKGTSAELENLLDFAWFCYIFVFNLSTLYNLSKALYNQNFLMLCCKSRYPWKCLTLYFLKIFWIISQKLFIISQKAHILSFNLSLYSHSFLQNNPDSLGTNFTFVLVIYKIKLILIHQVRNPTNQLTLIRTSRLTLVERIDVIYSCK